MRPTLLLIPALSLSIFQASASVDLLLPKVREYNIKGGVAPFVLGKDVKITGITHCQPLSDFMAENGCVESDDALRVIDVRLIDSLRPSEGLRCSLPGFPSERYAISISSDSIIISAEDTVGVIRASQTLRQLAFGHDPDRGVASLQAADIFDYPSFAVRGIMHDTGRSFIPIEELKRQIDLLSLFKVNVFHWHLTENQAWRMEVKAFPQLTSADFMTRDKGLFYTAEECRDLEKYAAERGVTVIPEIDMPGHSAAFSRAMGYSMQTPEGVEALKTILKEVASAFPLAPYIHIGADEVDITYPGFIEEMSDFVHSLGKKAVAWNPIHGKNVAPSMGIDLTQLWSTRGLAVEGIPAIDCRYNYANHFDVYADLPGIYFSTIYYRTSSPGDIAGTIQGYWNDRRLASPEDIVRQNNLYAYAIAMAERAWGSGMESFDKYIEERGAGLSDNPEETVAFKDWERRFDWYKHNILPTGLIPYMPQSHIEWTLSDNRGRKAKARGAGVYLRHTWPGIIPTRLPYYLPGDTVWAERTIIAPRDMEADAYIEFQNYSRSEKDLAPEQGRWDRKGSRIWINGAEITPPVWTTTATEINHEVALGNENLSAREPLKVSLHKGPNTVKVMIPCVDAPGVRLNKWMFTAILADPVTGRSL